MRMLLIHCHDQTAGGGLLIADVHQAFVCLLEHVRQPFAVEAQCGTQPLAHAVAVEFVLERGRQHGSVGSAPLHVAVDAWKVDRPYNAAVTQRVAIAVLVIGEGLPIVVTNERNRSGVAAEGCSRQTQASMCA